MELVAVGAGILLPSPAVVMFVCNTIAAVSHNDNAIRTTAATHTKSCYLLLPRQLLCCCYSNSGESTSTLPYVY